MSKKLRVAVEVGPKGRRCVAVAPDWPGLERAAKTPDAAIERLQEYVPRYAHVAKLAALESEFAAQTKVELIETFPGTSSTDYWGVSFAFSSQDLLDMSTTELERELGLMKACWSHFDQVRARVSAEMQRSPRGAGRDRDRIVSHTLRTEQEWSRKVGLPTSKDVVITDSNGLKTFRDDYCTAIRDFHADGKMARKWPLRYLIRRTAYHTMDHTWEMEDKDLTA